MRSSFVVLGIPSFLNLVHIVALAFLELSQLDTQFYFVSLLTCNILHNLFTQDFYEKRVNTRVRGVDEWTIENAEVVNLKIALVSVEMPVNEIRFALASVSCTIPSGLIYLNVHLLTCTTLSLSINFPSPLKLIL